MSSESSSADRREATGEQRAASHAAVREPAFTLPERPASRWHRAGVSRRGERLVEVAGVTLVVLFATGWAWSIAEARSVSAGSADPATASTFASAANVATRSIATAIAGDDPHATAYLMNAALDLFAGERGASGKLEVAIAPANTTVRPDSLPAGARVRYSEAGDVTDSSAPAPRGSGIWQIAIQIGSALRPISDFSLISLVPMSARENGRIGGYFVGRWPTENTRVRAPVKAPAGRYAPPSGLIEVTPDNADLHVSQHFTLRDFLTHDQANVWPKYLVLQLRLVDKLELVLSDLQQRGIDPSGVHVMSGFRTPQYNAHGGDTAGRADLSRHMYGDAADIYIDDDHDGRMDDLNHDGRVTIDDARVIEAAVDRVEAAHPELVGGAGVYVSAPGHGPFIHIDTRGYRARWVSTSGE